MATKKKTAAPAAVVTVGMAAIVAATQAGSFVYTLPAEHDQLVKDGLVEINSAVPADANGGIATRATQKGIDSMAATNSPTTAGVSTPATKVKPTFKIDADVPIPTVSGRGRTGESMYPFDALEVGQSFFVAKEAKNLASTISSANARYATTVEGQTRKTRKGVDVPLTQKTREFIVRSVTEGGTKGSRIWRKA